MTAPTPNPPHLPQARVPRIAAPRIGGRAGGGRGAGGERDWQGAAGIGPLLLADGSGAAVQATRVRLGWDDAALYVRFECRDRDAWGTFQQRNDPLYQEEAVEIFLAPGAADPRRYHEIEVSPRGTVFAAHVHNPTGLRRDLVADTAWPCAGLGVEVGATGRDDDWWAAVAIPWPALLEGAAAAPPRRWRANFYRIERPRGGEAELSCWSPTLTTPPDFHRPERFGTLDLVG